MTEQEREALLLAMGARLERIEHKMEKLDRLTDCLDRFLAALQSEAAIGVSAWHGG